MCSIETERETQVSDDDYDVIHRRDLGLLSCGSGDSGGGGGSAVLALLFATGARSVGPKPSDGARGGQVRHTTQRRRQHANLRSPPPPPLTLPHKNFVRNESSVSLQNNYVHNGLYFIILKNIYGTEIATTWRRRARAVKRLLSCRGKENYKKNFNYLELKPDVGHNCREDREGSLPMLTIHLDVLFLKLFNVPDGWLV